MRNQCINALLAARPESRARLGRAHQARENQRDQGGHDRVGRGQSQ